MDERSKRARWIQEQLRRVLFDFNPIGFPVPSDEYDNLISAVYQHLRKDSNPSAIAEYLQELESGFGGTRSAEDLMPFAEELSRVDVHLEGNGKAT